MVKGRHILEIAFTKVAKSLGFRTETRGRYVLDHCDLRLWMWFERGHYTSNIMIEGKVLTGGTSGKFQRDQMDFEYQVGGFSDTHLPASVYDIQASHVAYLEAESRASEISGYLQQDIRSFLVNTAMVRS